MAQASISADFKDVVKLMNNLNNASRSAYPLAVRGLLNRQAYEASNKIKTEVLSKEFTLRNAYIRKTIQYQKCHNTFKIDQMSAQAGQADSFAGKRTEQLEKQEFGKSVVSKGKYTKVATLAARSGSYSKKVAPSKLISKLSIQKSKDLVNNITKTKSKQLSQLIMYAKGHKHADHKVINVIATSSKGRKGIYNITSAGKVTLLYAFNRKVTHIKRTKWLEPTAKLIGYRSNEFFMEEGAKRLEKTLSKGLKGS